MRTEIAPPKYERDGLRYASDLSDAEWILIEPYMPSAKSLGGPRTMELREVVNAILYLLRAGYPWHLLPKYFLPRSTLHQYFYAWRDSATRRRINHHLLMVAREAEGHDANPSAGVIDIQSGKTMESGGERSYDAGKKIKGRKCHIVTDTLGLLIGLMVHGAGIQDRDGAPDLVRAIRHDFPWLSHLFGDGGYARPKLNGVLKNLGQWTLEIIKRSDTAKGFEVLPRRWVAEQTLAWLGRCRILAKGWDTSVTSAEAWILIANIRLVSRRIARYYCFT